MNSAALAVSPKHTIFAHAVVQCCAMLCQAAQNTRIAHVFSRVWLGGEEFAFVVGTTGDNQGHVSVY